MIYDPNNPISDEELDKHQKKISTSSRILDKPRILKLK